MNKEMSVARPATPKIDPTKTGVLLTHLQNRFVVTRKFSSSRNCSLPAESTAITLML